MQTDEESISQDSAKDTDVTSITSAEWDNYQEASSYFESLDNSYVDQEYNGVKSSTDDHFLDDQEEHFWPPRNPSSETENTGFLIPTGTFEIIAEEDVFIDTLVENTAIMPSNPDRAFKTFKNNAEIWTDEYERTNSIFDSNGVPHKKNMDKLESKADELL